MDGNQGKAAGIGRDGEIRNALGGYEEMLGEFKSIFGKVRESLRHDALGVRFKPLAVEDTALSNNLLPWKWADESTVALEPPIIDAEQPIIPHWKLGQAGKRGEFSDAIPGHSGKYDPRTDARRIFPLEIPKDFGIIPKPYYFTGMENLNLADAAFANDFKKQAEGVKKEVEEYLTGILGNEDALAALIGGGIAARAAGIQPVFVTNWPDATFQTVLSGISALGSLGPLFVGKTAEGAAVGTAERYGLAALFGPEVALGLAAILGGAYLYSEMSSDNSISAPPSPPNSGITEKAPKSGEHKKTSGLFGIFDEMFSAFADIFSPKQAFAYDMGALNNIGNYHGDSMRGLTDSAPETLAPQIKVTVNQPPIQNKVNMLKVESGLRWIRGLALKFSDTVFECLDFFFHGVFGSRRWNSGLPAIGR